MKNTILTCISKTIDDLRLEIRDREMEILTLKNQLKEAKEYIAELERNRDSNNRL